MTSRGSLAYQLPRRRPTPIGRPRYLVRSPAAHIAVTTVRCVRLVAARYGGSVTRVAHRMLRRERVLLGLGSALALAVVLTVLTANAQATPSSLDVLKKLPAYSLVYPGSSLLKTTETTDHSRGVTLATITRVFALPQAKAGSTTPLNIIGWYSWRLQRNGWLPASEQTNGITDAPYAWATTCDHFDLLVEDPSDVSPVAVAGLNLSGDALVFFVTMDQGCLPQG